MPILLAAAALMLVSQPAISQSTLGGIIANDIFSAILGSAAGEGLSCLVQGCSSSSGTNWSTVNTQLSNLSTQLTQLNAAIQGTDCIVAKGVYSNYMAGTNATTLNAITLLAADLANIAADRQASNATQLTSDMHQLSSDEQNVSNLATIHTDMDGIVRGTAGAAGGIELFSNQLTSCHTYFNSNDFLLVQQQWALFALAQANACVIKINLDTNANGDPTDDINACKAYQADIMAAQPPQMANPPSPQPLGANAFIDVKTGIGWQVASLGNVVTASCGQLYSNNSAGGLGTAFSVCTVPGQGRSGAPWQLLPYYQDVQTMLKDSGCPMSGSTNPSNACYAGQGWPSGAGIQFFWADQNFQNVVDPSPNGPWSGGALHLSFCEETECVCANGDCYDWFNVIYINEYGKTANSRPPCWTWAAFAPDSGWDIGEVAWECGTVDFAAAGFIPTSQDYGAYYLYEWVGNGAPNGAPGVAFPTGYFWIGAPPFPAPATPLLRRRRPAA
jgi:hypothetical protein